MDTRKGPWFIIFSLLFLCFYTHLSIGASIISAGESISGDQTIISEGDGKFELGFFTPGGKLGLNKITYKSTLLTSWRNREDPAPGMFSLQLDPAGTSQYHILWNRSKIYWTSGTWNGHIYSLVPEMRLNYIFNFTYVSNEEENYFYYTLYNTSIISRLVMDLSGQIHQLSWYEDIGWNLFWSQPRQQCEVHALCGASGFCTEIALPFCGCLPGFEPRFPIDYLNLSDRSAGCERRFPLQCMNQASVNWKQLFVRMPNMKFPQNAQFLAAGTAEDCESACSNSCPCTAYAYGTGGCSVWNEDLLNAEQLSDGDTGGGDLYIKLTTSKLPGNKDQLLCIVLVLIWRWRQLVGPLKAVKGSLVLFEYRDLQSAFKDFSGKLGGGGFDSALKGILPDSTIIAVMTVEGH